MKRRITILLLLFLVCYQSCKEFKKVSDSISTSSEKEIIDPIPILCYEINEGRSFNEPLVLKKEFFGKVVVKTDLDTSKLKLVNVRILKTYLKYKKDSSAVAEFQSTDSGKKQKYQIEQLNILPLIEQYFDTVKVAKFNQTKDCEVLDSYSILLRIE